ncbi:MAG: hypothetical protein FJZ90_04640, partial [Chloroflexi bacterium]|nr:hypothetical protein [Chloroflexota bacterium]
MAVALLMGLLALPASTAPRDGQSVGIRVEPTLEPVPELDIDPSMEDPICKEWDFKYTITLTMKYGSAGNVRLTCQLPAVDLSLVPGLTSPG